ncbi:YeeE/YedE family protein [Thermoactinomyces sp. CICC 10521]|uniref:YeeE/YedE family protein n=2 Tax=Thermoactinomycetaceae TaxID=186824 RepID=A0A7W1X811_9BACL|nr:MULTISPECIES: YeeE/YedE family protein [Thermoactinomyces]MBA4541736.1 YeeE/YedE family protein [Thermoactinomyces daqus]MBH8597178.1 YeeE/YedE family protein [Thermoactinomyces sp. CICC 10523]MBH8602738.1 YeeE/YedE family protein [Thermoactinomyces sp. CICC 10522]MBH8606153.1 YeeE/YedE family protein [Thermoactinomyces sp. CICC 10521]
MPQTSLKSAPSIHSRLPGLKAPLVWIAILAFIVLGAFVYRYGWQKELLFIIGVLLGVALYHARFGFTSAFRELLSVGQGQGLRAHMLMLAIASVLFAVIFSTGTTLTGAAPQGNVEPIGISLVFGSFLFGIGMQLGGACASGCLYRVSGGTPSFILTLIGFIAGSVWAAYHWQFWSKDLPSLPPVSLATSTGLGYGGAALLQLILFAGIVLFTYWIAKRKNPPPRKPVPTAQGWKRIIRGSWPLWVSAIVLAVLNALTLFISGQPWGITSAFALWGSKILQSFGVDVSSWVYWSGAKAKALQSPILADKTSLMDFGIIIGAFFAAAASGTFKVQKIPFKIHLASLIGGIMMGYGARLAYGCNIGSYFSGIASFSLHGWIWAIFALLGTYAGLKLRPLFGLKNPKQSDSFC